MKSVTCALLIPMFAATLATAQENAVYQMLLADGVTLSDGTVIKLPAPTMTDGVDAAEQQQLLELAAGRNDLPRFTRKTRVAPINLQMKSVKNKTGARTGQMVDAWFIVHGTLEQIEQHLREEMKNPQPQQSDDGAGRAVTSEELTARDIEPLAENDATDEGYSYFQTSLLDRVHLSGVARSNSTRQEQSFLMAFVLDERFANDAELPNQWRPIDVNELGKQVLGEPQPYSGCGGYVKATELIEPTGALLVEMHVAFNEPHAWFEGANLLRSKLPLVVQERVRDFRGELERMNRD